jgi:replication factor C subunit 2/4
MTQDAQTALRRTMEKYSRETRFCLICNYVSRIIDPLTSRCAKFRFQLLPSDKMLTRLRYICEHEGLTAEDTVLEQLIRDAQGDMRKAIIYLQSVSRLHGKTITSAAVTEVSGRIPTETVETFLHKCRVESFEQVQKFVKDLIAEGHSAFQFLDQLNDAVVTSPEFSDLQVARIAEKLAKVDKSLSLGCMESLQLMDIAATIIGAMRDPSLSNKA